jgi:hypothetical protein
LIAGVEVTGVEATGVEATGVEVVTGVEVATGVEATGVEVVTGAETVVLDVGVPDTPDTTVLVVAVDPGCAAIRLRIVLAESPACARPSVSAA